MAYFFHHHQQPLLLAPTKFHPATEGPNRIDPDLATSDSAWQIFLHAARLGVLLGERLNQADGDQSVVCTSPLFHSEGFKTRASWAERKTGRQSVSEEERKKGRGPVHTLSRSQGITCSKFNLVLAQSFTPLSSQMQSLNYPALSIVFKRCLTRLRQMIVIPKGACVVRILSKWLWPSPVAMFSEMES